LSLHPYDEDRSRTGHGLESMTRRRRFAIGAIKANSVINVAQKMRELTGNVRLVLDYFRMTNKLCAAASA